MTSGDFDLARLYAALDEQRRERRLTWEQTAREISRAFERTSAGPLSASTLTGIPKRGQIEGDGVLQMLRWLNRTPESFVSGVKDSDVDTALPRVRSDQVLRFDAHAVHAALNARRHDRGLTWIQVATEIGGVTASGLTRLQKGGRVAFPGVMRICRWLGRPAASFTHG
jgi:hypothetical protein